MLRLFEGGFSSNAHDELIRAIGSAISSGRRTYLIVPGQQTVAVECEMSKILPASAPLTFEVTNFTRLCDTIFRLFQRSSTRVPFRHSQQRPNLCQDG